MDLDFDFFKIDKSLLEPKKGKLLISEPFLQDAYFKRSVVLLTEHNNEGSIGFVLNKPTELSINEILDDFPDIDLPVSIGGPVATNTIHFCHTLGEVIPNSVKIVNNIYWGGSFEALKDLIKTEVVDPEKIRFFIGYSGWAPGQLEREISERSWVVADVKSDNIIYQANKDTWKKILARLGKKYQMWTNYPENPVMN